MAPDRANVRSFTIAGRHGVGRRRGRVVADRHGDAADRAPPEAAEDGDEHGEHGEDDEVVGALVGEVDAEDRAAREQRRSVPA